mmetsp:Transcript_34776/g.73394  ORF Transcript_34776/g.73394 Transcript_34776/m.73394 type:complete len:210 (+) Transcript_34776:574-1203(+)
MSFHTLLIILLSLGLKERCCFIATATMNLIHLFVFLFATMLQLGGGLADIHEEPATSGKPGHDTNRALGWWSTSSSKTSKSSKSTDHPTLFPTLAPTLFPTFSPTYCGKASKSSWTSSRRLNSWSWSKSTKSSCDSGPRSSSSSSSWKRGGGRRSNRARDNSRRLNSGGGKPNAKELRQESGVDIEFSPIGMKVRRRRIFRGGQAEFDI